MSDEEIIDDDTAILTWLWIVLPAVQLLWVAINAMVAHCKKKKQLPVFLFGWFLTPIAGSVAIYFAQYQGKEGWWINGTNDDSILPRTSPASKRGKNRKRVRN